MTEANEWLFLMPLDGYEILPLEPAIQRRGDVEAAGSAPTYP